MVAWEHMSESNEHFTPEYILRPARVSVGGDFELDPASSPLANDRPGGVSAKQIFTIGDSGHNKPWRARSIILNPPGGSCDIEFRQVIKASKEKKRLACVESGECGLPPGHKHEGVDSSAKRWWFKAMREWVQFNFDTGVFIGFSLDMLQTMQVNTPEGFPIPLDFPICFPRNRIPYDKLGQDGAITKGSSPPHASFITFMPPMLAPERAIAKFVEAFSPIGRVLTHYTAVR